MSTENEWFKYWFDSKYYHILYRNRSQNEANYFIENSISKLNLDLNQNILDLGCGKGRHAYKLSQHFKRVTGLDLSPKSIRDAKELKKENLEFHVMDMRSFKFSKPFNYIFNLFTSFGYFEDINQNLDVLNCCYNNLEDNGKILIDFLNPSLIKKKIVVKETKQINNIVFNLNKSIVNDYIVKDIEILDQEKQMHFQEKVQLLEKENFIEMFNKSGFELISTFGDYHLNEYTNNSERLILWAKKIKV